MSNPFSLSFGTIPTEFINRPMQTNSILDTFMSDSPSTHMFMITGVRGSGKTVMLTEISRTLRQREDWIVVEVNPEADINESIVSKLYNIDKVRPLFVKSKISIAYGGTGVSFEKDAPKMTDTIILEKMLNILKKHGKKLLIAIDEAINNEYIKRFAHDFQILIRQEMDIYLIMTGLYENIHNLQNEKTLTFLYRAPRISLEPLSISSIAQCYSTIFSIDRDKAITMAKLTNGYPFAFQVLGYLCWNTKNTDVSQIYNEYDQYLSEYVYDKIWSELNDKDRNILNIISQTQDYIKIQQVREAIGMSSNLFSTYRDRLIRKGIVDVSRYGYINVILPRFKEYVKFRYEFDRL